MAPKSLSFSPLTKFLLVTLTVGVFLVVGVTVSHAASEASATTLPEVTIVSTLPLGISGEVSNGTGVITHDSLPLGISGEVSNNTGANGNLPLAVSGEVSNDTSNDNLGGGGGGGGGGSSGGGGGSSGGGRGFLSGVPTVLGAVTSSCPMYLTRYLHQGWNNDRMEVIKLQVFLRVFEGFSSLPITGIYDQATFNAVSAFQSRYSRDVLSPWGISYSTGFTFITTRQAINNIYCARSTATNLDLRHVYDSYFAASNGHQAVLGISAEFGGSKEGASSSKATSSLAAVVGVGILKLSSGWWLVLLLILAIAALAYFIWKLRPETDGASSTPPSSAVPMLRSEPTEGEEVIVGDTQEEEVVEQPPLDKLT